MEQRKFVQVLRKDELVAAKGRMRHLKLEYAFAADRAILQKFFCELADRIETDELSSHGFFGAYIHLLADGKRHPNVTQGIWNNLEEIVGEIFWIKPEFAAEVLGFMGCDAASRRIPAQTVH